MREWHDLSTMHFDNGCRGTFLTSAYLHDILGSTTQEIMAVVNFYREGIENVIE